MLKNSAVPKLIIEFPEDLEERTPKFLSDQFEKIVDGKIHDLPVFIISITGVCRSGKSFLLNLLRTYLDFYIQNGTDNGWMESAMKIEGGDWALSKDPVTRGIWMWDRPFEINKVAILLMDCQGMGDSGISNAQLDSLNMYLGVLLADVQIINVRSVIQSNDLERLYMCSEYAEDGSKEAVSSIWSTPVFLIRDFQAEEPGERPDEFENMIVNARSDTLKKYGSGIQQAFGKVHTFALPDPGKTVKRGSEREKKLAVSDVDEDFLDVAKHLFRRLVVDLPKIKSVNGESTVKRFKGLEECILDRETGSTRIKSLDDVVDHSEINQSFLEARQFYDSEMKKVSNMEFETEAQVEFHLEKILTDSVKLFEGNEHVKKYGHSSTTRKYLRLLEEKRDANGEKRRSILQAQTHRREKEEYERKRREASLNDHEETQTKVTADISVKGKSRHHDGELEIRSHPHMYQQPHQQRSSLNTNAERGKLQEIKTESEPGGNEDMSKLQHHRHEPEQIRKRETKGATATDSIETIESGSTEDSNQNTKESFFRRAINRMSNRLKGNNKTRKQQSNAQEDNEKIKDATEEKSADQPSKKKTTKNTEKKTTKHTRKKTAKHTEKKTAKHAENKTAKHAEKKTTKHTEKKIAKHAEKKTAKDNDTSTTTDCVIL